jgi:hypothetical protein
MPEHHHRLIDHVLPRVPKLRLAHLQPQIIPLARPLPHAGETRNAAVKLRRPRNQFLDDHRLAHPRPAEQPRLSPAHIRRQQINHLDPRLKYLRLGLQILEQRRRLVNRPRRLHIQRTLLVDHLAQPHSWTSTSPPRTPATSSSSPTVPQPRQPRPHRLQLHDIPGFAPGTYTLIDAAYLTGALGPNLFSTLNGYLPRSSPPTTISSLVVAPIPEPTSLTLLGIGAMAMAIRRQKKRKLPSTPNASSAAAPVQHFTVTTP